MIAPARDVQRVLDHRHQREQLILDAITGPCTVEEIADLAYADTPQAPAGLRVSQTMAHLDRLHGLGRVRRAGDRWEWAG